MGDPLLLDRRKIMAGAAAAVGLTCVGCSGTNAAGPLQILGNPYNEGTYRALANAYGAPVALGFTPRESEDIVRQLLLRAFSGSPLPDAVFLNGDLIRLFADRGLAQPIGDLLPAKLGVRRTRIGGDVYGVPFGLSVPVVLYNQAHLSAAGQDPEAPLPIRWSEILALAARIDKAIPNVAGGFMEHDSGGAFGFLTLMQSAGVPLQTEDGQASAFLNAAGASALEVLAGFGRVGQAGADMSRRQARRAFQAGGIGIFVTMSSIVAGLKSAPGAPRFRVGPVPLDPVRGSIPSAGPIGIVLAQDAERRAEAADFLAFAATRGQPILTKTSGYLPANPGLSGDWKTELQGFADPSRITGWFTFPGRNAVKICDMIQNLLQMVATLEVSPAKAIERLADTLPPLLPRPAQGNRA